QPESERETRSRELATDETRKPFDLARGPLVRVCLLRLTPEEHVLLLTMHHIVSDGWSMEQVFFRGLAVLYRAFTDRQPSPRSAPAVQYADYAVWQRQWLCGQVLQTQLAYRKDRLDGAPALELPTDRPRAAVQRYRGSHQAVQLSAELTRKLHTLSRQEGVTLFMTLLPAFQVLLSRYSGQGDVSVGIPVANRNRPETEGLIGFFVNTLVLRTDLSVNPPFRELLARVRDGCLAAYDHQDIPFEKLVEELQPQRDPSRSPLFQAFFVLQHVPQSVLQLPGLTLKPLEAERSVSAKFDLTL